MRNGKEKGRGRRREGEGKGKGRRKGEEGRHHPTMKSGSATARNNNDAATLFTMSTAGFSHYG